MSVGENIARFRKEKGWTQAELGDKLGVSNQAVSKWELGTTMPDIMLLPVLADTFGVYIDELFSREIKSEIHYDHCAEFPWPDDDIIRGIVCKGRKILQKEQIKDRFVFEVKGDVKQVKSECSIEVDGNVSGGCQAGNNVLVSGSLSGGCACGADVVVSGSLSGGSNCGGEVTVGGNFSGGCNAGGEVTCGGNFSGDINCGALTVGGDVESVKIKGDVVCNFLKCDKVEGDVTIVKKD